MNVIETDGLGKRYRRTWALRDCHLTVPAGHVAALVGPNGAGKTTLLRILAGVATPTAGTATVLGYTPGSQRARDAVSAVDQTVPLYRHLRVRDLLAAARALNDQWDTDLAVQRLSSLNLTTSCKVSKLSGGQQAQLALTLALARRPRLLLLDEPLASLDPLARQEVLGWLMTCVAEDGLSVVFSSHVIAELERVATYLVVLSQGQVQVAATVDSLLDSHLALTGPAGDGRSPGWPSARHHHTTGRAAGPGAGQDRRGAARLGGPPGHDGGTRARLPAGAVRPRAAPTGGGAMTALMIKAINVPRMTRVTWYKHRASVLGIPGLFLLAAALLFIDSVLQRHWISSHHLTYCLAYAGNATSSRCLTQDSPYLLGVFAEFVNYWRTEGTVVAVFLLAAVTGLFAGVPWVAREFEGGGFRFTWTQSVSPLRWLLGTFGPLTLLAEVTAAICGVAAHWWFQVAQCGLMAEPPRGAGNHSR